MEQYLIEMRILFRVEPDTESVMKAVTRSHAGKWALHVLDAKGAKRRLQGEQVPAFGITEQYMTLAKHGLLYAEAPPAKCVRMAFSPSIDKDTGMPQLLQNYEHAFAKRSPEGAGAGKLAEKQMDINTPRT